jgi:hypothetical protein
MQLLLISLLFISGFSFIGIGTLSLSVYEWEKRRINKIINDKNENSTNVSSFGYANSAKEKIAQVVKKTTEKSKLDALKMANKMGKQINRTMVTIKDNDYQGGLTVVLQKIKDLSQNFWLYSKLAAEYIMKLNKTKVVPEEVLIEEDFAETVKAKSDIEETIERVTAYNTTQDDDVVDIVDIQELQAPIEGQKNGEEAKKQPDVATLDIASTKRADDDNDIFEKLENSILEKLKGAGLNHYDIWVELAGLYESYQEKEKALEIYAMVLKHAEGREKDIAKNKLIALS